MSLVNPAFSTIPLVPCKDEAVLPAPNAPVNSRKSERNQSERLVGFIYELVDVKRTQTQKRNVCAWRYCRNDLLTPHCNLEVIPEVEASRLWLCKETHRVNMMDPC